mmetsp:Transcript_20978/g.63040  ORF Transcript_20978/g.63040 Transcript_20978/m.63040 type:complete len:390 (-) Transcript_20978:342-1511(-)
MRLAGSLPRRKSLSSLVLRQDRVSARVQLSRRRGQRAVDKDVLAQRSVEAGGERVALEPIVDGDVELAGSGKALHLVEPVGGQEERGARRHLAGWWRAGWEGAGRERAQVWGGETRPSTDITGYPLGSSRLVSANLDGHDVRVPEERVAVVVGVRDVGEGEVVHLSARQPRLELARARSDKVLHQHHRGVGCVQPGRVDESEALGSRNLQQHRILPVVVQNRRLGRGRHPQVARLQRGRDELLDKGRQRREAEVGQVSRRGLLDSDVLQRRDDPLRLGLRGGSEDGPKRRDLAMARPPPPPPARPGRRRSAFAAGAAPAASSGRTGGRLAETSRRERRRRRRPSRPSAGGSPRAATRRRRRPRRRRVPTPAPGWSERTSCATRASRRAP